MRATVFVLAVLAALPALAQVPQPAGMQPAPESHNTQDRLFVQLFGAGNLAEVQAGRMAGDKSAQPEVKRFAQQMAQEHGAAVDKLQGLAQRSKIPMPRDVLPEHRGQREYLQQLSGPLFDLEYLRGQVAEHQKAATLLQWHMSFGQDAELVRFSAATLPDVLRHLEHVQGLLAQLSGAPTRY